MKLRLLPVIFALFVAIAACNNSSKTVESPSPEPSPSVQASLNPITSNWYIYSASDGTYTAKFPAQPKEENQTTNSAAGKIDYVQVIYTDGNKQRVYATSTSNIPLPQGVKPSDFNVEKGLDNARDGAAENTKTTVISEKKISQNGYPGREITMRNDKNIAILHRMFIDPKEPKLYQALVVAVDGNIEFPEATAFLESLTITK